MRMAEDGAPVLAGCWATLGNAAGVGEALRAHHKAFRTFRGHNERTMAHALIAQAGQLGRAHAVLVTSSAGPRATDMVTAAALADANRVPMLLVPPQRVREPRP